MVGHKAGEQGGLATDVLGEDSVGGVAHQV
jgi:hypothetical protein